MVDNQNQTDWYGASLETETTPMIDSASGRPLILRTFEFAVKPSSVAMPQPSRQQLFNLHWPQIRDMIRFDGLVANEDVEPRVVIGKKRYRIFVLCEPRFRTMIVEKPTNLQTIFKPKLTKKPIDDKSKDTRSQTTETVAPTL